MKTKSHPTRLCHHILSRRSRTEADSCRAALPPQSQPERVSPCQSNPAGGSEATERLVAPKRREGGLPLPGEGQPALRSAFLPYIGSAKEGDEGGGEGGIAVPCFSNSRPGLSRFVPVCPALFSMDKPASPVIQNPATRIQNPPRTA
jgi:hypothetical protein